MKIVISKSEKEAIGFGLLVVALVLAGPAALKFATAIAQASLPARDRTIEPEWIEVDTSDL